MTREEQIERAEDRCPCCGGPVRVVSADEGTSHYEPVAQPVDVTDEMAERVCRAFLGSDAISLLKCFDADGDIVKYIYVGQDDGPRLMRIALRAALEGKEQAVAQHTRGCIAGDIDAECPCEQA